MVREVLKTEAGGILEFLKGGESKLWFRKQTHQNIHKEGNILRQASVDVILSSDVQSCCCYNVSVRQVLKKPTSLMRGGGCYLDPSILSFLFPPPPPEYAPKSGLFDKRLLRLYQLKCLSTSESMGWHFLHINSPLNHSFKS